jgi:hypothetical protein
MEKVNYAVFSMENLDDLQNEARIALVQGWKLHGGIQIETKQRHRTGLVYDGEPLYENYRVYTQFLVHYDPLSKEEKDEIMAEIAKREAERKRKAEEEKAKIAEREAEREREAQGGSRRTNRSRNRKNRTRRQY